MQLDKGVAQQALWSFGRFFLMAIFISAKVCGQNPSKDDSLAIKLLLFPETLYNWDHSYESSLQRFLKLGISFDTLNSYGFSDLTFLAISPYMIGRAKMDSTPTLPSNCEYYIIAIGQNPKNILRISGFVINDYSYLFIDRAGRPIPRRNFLRSHFIEEVGLRCLYDSWRKRNMDCEKFSCICSCSDVLRIH